MAQENVRPARKKRRFRRDERLAVFVASLDLNLLFTLIFLLGFGLIMVYSASSFVAMRDWGDQSHYFTRQLLSDLIGLAAMTILVFIPYTIWEKWAWFAYLAGMVFVFLVIPFGIESHHAKRWIAVPGIGLNFQPAEAAKLFMIIFLAAMVNKLGREVNSWKGFWFLVLSPVPICAEIYLITENLSSAIIVFGIAFIMCFIASRDYKKYLGMMAVGAAALAGIVAYVANTDLDSNASFRLTRISAWLHPENSTESTAHQALQSMYAIGNGGFWGQGLGQSVQKISALPEPHNDMIFAIICEELGVVGAVALILLFVLLLWQMVLIARATRKRFGFMLVVGVIAHISIQVVLNIAVATNSIPNTGVSLPFISYGGSSVLFLLSEVGLVLSVNRQNKIEAMSE